MSDQGRNGRCRCGSGRKAKRCCGLRRGPSEFDLARAWLDVEARTQARILARLDDDELDEVFEEVLQLPRNDMALQVPLPRLVYPELEDLREAIAEDDVDEVFELLPAGVARVDTPLTRQALARSILARRDQGRIDKVVAAAAIVDLASSRHSSLLRSSLFEALAVSAGATTTPSGLLVAASSPI